MRAFVFILFTLFAATVFADEKKYGSFTLNTDIPDTLFFIDEIKANDSFELRKALRNHDIQNIVLASPGGSVWEGLQMAGIIFDKRIRTYVPEEAQCASACAFLFFAGDQRKARGRLGVHQFYSGASQETAKIGQTQQLAQFTVSEIIGFLNEFGTPAFVYERMFQDIDMYYFSDEEIQELSSDLFEIDEHDQRKIAQYVNDKIKDELKLQTKTDNKIDTIAERKRLTIVAQQNLNRLGCSAGVADGIVGKRTKTALRKYGNASGEQYYEKDLHSPKFIEKIKNSQIRCPKPTSKSYPKDTFFGYKYWRGGCLNSSLFRIVSIDCPGTKIDRPAIQMALSD